MTRVRLHQIESPEVLRDMDLPALEALCEEMRLALIDKVFRTGGHLGSNLGVVELMVGLHRVFDFRRDRIVFDDPILFAMDSDEILHESDALLDEIAKTLQEHEEIAAVRVEGHTDATGSAEHNQELSERRAEAVVEALRERGVTQTLSAQGFGKTRPLCQEDTEACHGQNRRVELHIVR